MVNSMHISDDDIIDVLGLLERENQKSLRAITERITGAKMQDISDILLIAVQRGYVEAIVGDDKILYLLTEKGFNFFHNWFL